MGDITREQLQGLKNKFDLLQGDRKAYFETYETTKNTNDKQIAELRKRSKELRRALAAVQKEAAGGSTRKGGVAKAQAELKSKRTEYDKMRAESAKRQTELQELKDAFRDLELEARKPNTEDSPLTRKIRMLENRLDKAMIKYNEAQSIRKTYEQIVKRLKEERVGFDNQLAALERTLAAKQHDLEELMLLAGDANHAKELAVAELSRVRAFKDAEQERRAKERREKTNMAKAKSQMKELAIERETMRKDLVAEMKGDLAQDEEEALKRSLDASKKESESLLEAGLQHRRKIDVYEEAFRKIKEATGVSDVNEVIQKIVSQEDQQASLMATTRENASKIEALNADLSALKAKVDELKFSGPGGRSGARKMVDGYEEKLTLAQQRLDRGKDKYERLAKILINVKAGVEHLTEKLASLREDYAGPPPASEVTDDTIVDVLYYSEGILVKVLGRVKEAAEEEEAAAAEGAPAPGAPVISSLGISEDDITTTRLYNTRIDLMGREEDDRGGWESDDKDGMDEDAPNRETLKASSHNQVMANTKSGKKKPRRRGQVD